MRLTVVQEGSDDIHAVEIAPDKSVADLKIMLETQTVIPKDRQRLLSQGTTPPDGHTISATGLSEGDIIALQITPDAPQQRRQPQPAAASSSEAAVAGVPSFSGMAEQFQLRRQAEALRRQAQSDPNVMATLSEQAPPLAQAVTDSGRFAQLFIEASRARQAQQHQMAELDDDNQTAEKQERIMEMINQQRVLENRQAALQDYPEGELTACTASWLLSREG